MPQTFDILLNFGQDEGADRVFLEGGPLAAAQNCRLSRDGRLEVRPGFAALSTDTAAGAAIVAYDLVNFWGRLMALGDVTAAGRATDLFEWSNRLGQWRGTAGVSATARLPQVTDVRRLGGVPDQAREPRSVRLAAGGGLVCALIVYGGDADAVVHVFDPATDQTIYLAPIALRIADVVAVGSVFWFVGTVDVTGEDIYTASYDPASDPAPSTPALDTSESTVLDVTAAPFGATGWAYAYAASENGGGGKTKDATGATVATVTVAGTFVTSGVAGNAAGDAWTIVLQGATGASGPVTARTYDAAGALSLGPTTVHTTSTANRMMSVAIDDGALVTVAVNAASDSDVLYRTISQADHALGTATTYFDAQLRCQSAFASGRQFAVVVDAAANDQSVGTHHIVDLTDQLPQAFLQPQLAATSPTGPVHKAATAGSKIYVAITTVLQDTGARLRRAAVIYEAETAGTGRRQMAAVGGELLISGGLPLTYDGRVLAEQGFAERPAITAAAATGTLGSLTQLGVYSAVPVWEVFDPAGRLTRSQGGDVAEETLTGTDDEITWTVTTPHSLRRHPNYADQLATVRAVVYRSEAGEGVFFADQQTVIPLTDVPAETVDVESSRSDTDLIDNAVFYEQSQTPLSHVAPPPYRYIYAARERAFAGGQPDREQWTQSKLLFPGEPVTWASPNQLGFSGRVGEPITAVAAFESVGIVWSEQGIWQIPGRGPEHDGSGDFDAAAVIASPGGCIDWRSVIVAPPGAFFQMRADRLMLLDRGGQVSWAGGPIQDTLAAFPNVVGAVYVRELDQVVFACTNNANNAARFLVLDLTNGQWFVDTIGEGVRAVSELNGRLVYVNAAGVVKQQDAAVGQGSDAMPTLRIETPDFRFFGAAGWGDVCKILLSGTFVGACNVEAFISYDGAASWTSLGSVAVTQADAGTYPLDADGIALGPVTKQWIPNIRAVSRFSLRFDVTAGTNTGGLRLHAISLEVEAQTGTARLPSRDKR